jgi:hypothetical protein
VRQGHRLALLFTLISIVVAGCASAAANPLAEPQITVVGSVRIETARNFNGLPPECTGSRRLAGLHPGAPVVVTDRGGAPLATGQVTAGVLDAVADRATGTWTGPATCTLHFEVPGVPADAGRYLVHVADLEPWRVNRDELREGVHRTLG